jgi:hypothetical protein
VISYQAVPPRSSEPTTLSAIHGCLPYGVVRPSLALSYVTVLLADVFARTLAIVSGVSAIRLTTFADSQLEKSQVPSAISETDASEYRSERTTLEPSALARRFRIADPNARAPLLS